MPWRLHLLLAPLAAALCREDFAARFPALTELSGAPTRAQADYFDHLLAVEGPETQAAYVLNISEVSASLCWAGGARYWELTVSRRLYLDPFIERLAGCEACEAFKERVKRLAPQIHVGFCAPESCEAFELREDVAVSYFMAVLGSPVAFPTPSEAQLQVQELSHWSQLRLDFLIAGVEHCGTTSLGRWLQQLEAVEFTCSGEDDVFFRHDRLLPFVSEVEAFNRRWRYKETLKGLRHPNIWSHLRVRMALARIPNLLVLVAVCDPLSRLEKAFWWNHICNPSLPHPENVALTRPEGCYESISSLLDPESKLSLKRFEMQSSLQHLKELYGKRLLVIHQDFMRDEPRKTFLEIVSWLSIEKIPAEMQLGRHNHRPGHRTDLCQNSTLIDIFKALLSSELLGGRFSLNEASCAKVQAFIISIHS